MEVRKLAKKTVSVIEPKQSLLVDKAKYQQTRMAAYATGEDMNQNGGMGY